MGYVGLTLAVVMAERGFRVYGVERFPDVVESLNKKKPHFFERGLQEKLEAVAGKNLFFSGIVPSDISMDVFIISVGTPLEAATKKPILSHLEKAVHDIAPHVGEGGLVVLRSTVPVGITRNTVLPILRAFQKGKFFLAFCPERTVEGKALEELSYLPQIIGGLDRESVDHASDIFGKITKVLVRVSSLETAEMAKLLDNSYRDLTFGFANEVARAAKALGLNGPEVIRAANYNYERTKIPLPGYTAGPCLEKDPHIFFNSAVSAGYTPRIIAAARATNEGLEQHTAERILEFLRSMPKNLGDARVFISGLAFKGRPETGDLRGSSACNVVRMLQGAGIKKIFGHDFVALSEDIARLGVTPSSFEEGFEGADCFLLMNNHVNYETAEISHLLPRMNNPALFFDGWHMFNPHIIKTHPHLTYEGLGSA